MKINNLEKMNKIAFMVCVAAMCAYANPIVYDTAARVYSPYLTSTETVIWENRNLGDIVSLSCMMKGGWIGTATVGSGVIYDRTPSSFKVQFQCISGGCKMARAYFRQVGANIVVRADKAGLGEEANYRSRMPDSLFNMALATSDSNGTYGAYAIEAFGDTTWTVNAIPENEDGVVVSNGTLRVNVASDMTVSTAISGNGALHFVGAGQPIESAHVFDRYVTTASQTLIENADVFDLELTSAVFNGGWCGRGEGARPYNVTSNLADKTMTVQMQLQFGNWNNIYGVIVQLSQSGDDVLIKGISTRQASRSDGQTLGSDMAGWTGSTASIATSAEAGGYGLESISFVKRAVPQVVLTGAKEWTGGTVADGCFVRIKESQLAPRSDVRVVNGGTVCLSAPGNFSVFTWNRYLVEEGSALRHNGSFAINRHDAIDVDGGTFEQAYANSNIYANDVMLTNGATVFGKNAIQIGYERNAMWRTTGNEEIRIDVPIYLVKSNAATVEFTIDAAADITFGKNFAELSSYRGMTMAKRGLAKATFAAGCILTGMVTLAEGTLRIGAVSSFGPLVLSGNAAVEVDEGATLTFGASADKDWSADAQLDIAGAFGSGAQVVRVGTDSTGLTAAQLKKIRINDMRCKIDDNGWLHPYSSGLIISFK